MNTVHEAIVADPQVDEWIWDLLGVAIHREWLGARQRSYDSQFLSDGFCLLSVDGLARDMLMQFFDAKNRIALDADDCAAGHWPSTARRPDVIASLNEKHHFYGAPGAAAAGHLEAYLERQRATIEAQLGAPFEVSNIRFDELLPSDSYGPSQWHSDGGPRFLRKILLYPGPLDRTRDGALEFFDRHGRRHFAESADRPVAVLYDTSFLLHRGYPPTRGPRPMIEITLKPARETVLRPVFAGHLARVPMVDDARLGPDLLKAKIECLEARACPVAPASGGGTPAGGRHGGLAQLRSKLTGPGALKRLSRAAARRVRRRATDADEPVMDRDRGPLPFVRGQVVNRCAFVALGPRAVPAPGWLSFDLPVPGGRPVPGRLAGDLAIPAATRSVALVYAAEILQTLNNIEAAAILAEARRVLARDGRLLIALPDDAQGETELADLLAAHGFRTMPMKRAEIVSQFPWVPGLAAGDPAVRFHLAACV